MRTYREHFGGKVNRAKLEIGCKALFVFRAKERHQRSAADQDRRREAGRRPQLDSGFRGSL